MIQTRSMIVKTSPPCRPTFLQQQPVNEGTTTTVVSDDFFCPNGVAIFLQAIYTFPSSVTLSLATAGGQSISNLTVLLGKNAPSSVQCVTGSICELVPGGILLSAASADESTLQCSFDQPFDVSAAEISILDRHALTASLLMSAFQ
jgi:hypothetical protein